MLIKGMKTLIALALFLGIATGCSTKKDEGKEDSKVLTTDVIVIGGGISGLASAVFAADQGAEVIVLEKLGLTGGSGLLSSGALITCDTNGLIDGDDSVETNMINFTETAALGKSSGYPNVDRIASTLSETGETVNRLVDMGMTIGRTMSLATSSIVVVDGAGAGFANFLKTAAESKGVKIKLNCTGEELIVEDGTVVGVKAAGEEGEMELRAKTVILATGGFSQSAEKVAEWIPECVNVYGGRATVGNTGDGFDMALAAGAVLYENPWLMVSTTMPSPEYNREVGSLIKLSDSLLVNDEWIRFTNENPSSYSTLGNVLIENGYDHCLALMNANEENKSVLEKGIEMGEVVKGANAAELAEALNMDQEVLEKTISDYNDVCATGEDPLGKAAANLIALNNEEEIYAVCYYPTSIGTIAGVKTTENCEVIREDGSVIDGLFAVGEMSNREFYNYHYIGGASLGLYTTMGRLAGEQAAERAGK